MAIHFNNDSMRMVFFGTAAFSVPSLRACVAAGHDVAAVVTQPDRLGDRGRPAPRPVADVAEALGLPVQRPQRLRAPDAVAAVLALHPDALVVAAYGQILPGALLDAPAHGGINVHASLLPRWRGAAPVSAAIRAGDPETGVSIMQMDEGLDTGAVHAMRATPVAPREHAPQLAERLALLGGEALVEVLAGIVAGTQAPPRPQDDARATLAPRLQRRDGSVDWERHGAVEVDRMVRAHDPWPGVTAEIAGQRVRLLQVEPWGGDEEGPPGRLVGADRGAAFVATVSGVLRIDSVQPAGGRPMDAGAYLRGRRVAVPRRAD